MNRFRQVGAQQQRVARLEDLAHFTQELYVCWMFEVADGAAQEYDQQLLSLPASSSHLQQSIKIFALEADDADRINVAEFTLAHGERGPRDLDGAIGNMLMSAQRFEHPPRLLSATAAQLGHYGRRCKSRHNVLRMPAQKTLVGTSQTVFRKDADDFEKRGPNTVIQVLRRQFLLSGLGQTETYIGDEVGLGVGSKGVGQHAVLRNRSVAHAAKSCVHVLVMGLEPVAKRAAQHARGSTR